MASSGGVKHYFVDEAGEPNLFDKRGRALVGRKDDPRYFMIGFIELAGPDLVAQKLDGLRRELLADPYFSGVPSMQPERKRTALYFHANNDPWEVKYEVIKLLRSFNVKATVGIRRRDSLLRQHRALYESTGRKYKPNAVYDDLVAEVFRGKLHPGDENRVMFARRGERDRGRALKRALLGAGGGSPAVSSAYPHEAAGLQVVDYYLWAVQRMREMGEDRFFRALESQYESVMNLDSKPSKRRQAGSTQQR